MKILLTILKEVFVPIFITLITIELTTRHNKKIEKENFRIELYYIYEDIREILETYYSAVIENIRLPLNKKNNLNYKTVLSKFNTFIMGRNKIDKLTLRETKTLLDFEYNLNNSPSDIYKNQSLIFDISDEAKLMQSSLDKIYNFLQDSKLEKIKLYSIDEIKKMKQDKYGSEFKKKMQIKIDIEKRMLELEDILGNYAKVQIGIVNLPNDIKKARQELIDKEFELESIKADIRSLEKKLEINN